MRLEREFSSPSLWQRGFCMVEGTWRKLKMLSMNHQRQLCLQLVLSSMTTDYVWRFQGAFIHIYYQNQKLELIAKEYFVCYVKEISYWFVHQSLTSLTRHWTLPNVHPQSRTIQWDASSVAALECRRSP